MRHLYAQAMFGFLPHPFAINLLNAIKVIIDCNKTIIAFRLQGRAPAEGKHLQQYNNLLQKQTDKADNLKVCGELFEQHQGE